MNSNTTVIGEGNTKVLIFAGWMGDYTVFNPTLSLWDTSKYSIAFMDYRGYGKAMDQAGDFTLDEIASDGLASADALGWDKFHVIGHSMGGMVVQKLALLAPDRIQTVTGVAPVPASGFPMDADGKALFEGAIESPENRKQILDFTTGNQNDESWLNKMVEDSLATTTKDAYGKYLAAWSGTDFSSEVSSLKMPFFVIVGEHDLAITKEAMEQTYGKWISNCQITTLEKCGHYPMQENPQGLVTKIEAFINGNS